MRQSDVIIVGGGLAGLCCARRLQQCGIECKLLEAGDAVGGRVRTDQHDGFLLDRGFQIYLAGYPEGKRVLDLEALELMPFTRGALVRYKNRFHRVADPRSNFFAALKSLFNPVGSFRDKVRLLSLYNDSFRDGPDESTADYLRRSAKLSDAMIDRLFRPFFGGVFLERDLNSSSRLFRFLFRTFANGPGTIPAAGMQAIPEQIANGLSADTVQCHSRVTKIGPGQVQLADGAEWEARAVVVATDVSDAVGLSVPVDSVPDWKGTVTLYFSADTSPTVEPILVLDGDGVGPINNLVDLSAAAPGYAPAGKSLIAASTVGIPDWSDEQLETKAREQLKGWFGSDVAAWKLLRVYRIPRALPVQAAGDLEPWQRPVRLRPGLYVCGDQDRKSVV